MQSLDVLVTAAGITGKTAVLTHNPRGSGTMSRVSQTDDCSRVIQNAAREATNSAPIDTNKIKTPSCAVDIRNDGSCRPLAGSVS